MAACCPSSAWPALSPPEDYTPAGSEAALPAPGCFGVGQAGDLNIYTTGTPGAKAIIVCPEVFGWGGRLKGICDTLAGEGYFVVMPDFHRGTTAAGQPDFGAWVNQYTWESHIKNDFQNVFDFLSSQGATDIGAMGFCWGVWALSKASSEGFGLKCGVGPHPSTRLEGMMGGDEAAMMAKLHMPVLLLPAGDDPDNVKPGGAVAESVIAKGGASEPFPEMKHGWVSRGALSDAAVKRDVEGAITKAIDFFKKHM